MTTIYDAESTWDTIAAPVYYDDPDTYTIAEAWMSSPLGGLDDDLEYAETDTSDDRDRRGSRGKLFAALAGGVIGGATLGAVLFGYRPITPPTVVVPGFGVSTEQLPTPSTAPSSSTQPAQKPATAQSPAPTQAQAQSSAPKPVAAEPKPNTEVAAGPATPPAVAPPVVVDIHLPPLGDKPESPAPEPPKPDPPVFNPPNNELKVPDEPEPDPEPPNDIVIDAPLVDPSLKKPSADELKPVESATKDEPHRQVTSSRVNSIAKP